MAGFFLSMFDEHLFRCNQALGLPHACLLENLVVLIFFGYTLKIVYIFPLQLEADQIVTQKLPC